MARRGNGAAALALLVATAASAVAADRPGVAEGAAPVKLQLGQGLTPEVARKIRVGFAMAVAQSRDVPQCGALFRDLGADAGELLGRSYYVPAELNWGKQACPAGVLASTLVGSPLTRVCSGFGELGKKAAALVLLHEALHFAGLPERPHDPGAMAASEINDMVRERCRL